MLDSLTDFHDGAIRFTLPSKLVRYIEFENIVVFLLDEEGKQDKIIGVKYSREGGINHFYIAWEFQIIDGLNRIHRIHSLKKQNHKGKETVHCYGGGFDMEFYLNPDTGEIIDEIFSRW